MTLETVLNTKLVVSKGFLFVSDVLPGVPVYQTLCKEELVTPQASSYH